MLDTRLELPQSAQGIDFLWVELTNRCNLNCTHCYAESGPHEPSHSLTVVQYTKAMSDAYDAGCRKLQFIGGEPTLNGDLPELIRHARLLGYDFVEVFTNLNRLPEKLLAVFVEHNVSIATSVYGPDAMTHDVVTTVSGSFNRLQANLRRCLTAGLTVRAGFIEMDTNAGQYLPTTEHYRTMGLSELGHDRVRGIGRGIGEDGCCGMGELCGECAHGTLAIGPDGVVAPCIMSKQWAVGSLSDEVTIGDIVASEQLAKTRQQIREATHVDGGVVAICPPKTCAPYSATPCSPKGNGCSPCYPKG